MVGGLRINSTLKIETDFKASNPTDNKRKEGTNMSTKYITRTIEGMDVVALVFDKTTAEPSNITITLGRHMNDSKAIERAVRKYVETDGNLKLIDVVDVSYTTDLYGISEQDFMAHAVRLDPNTRKPI